MTTANIPRFAKEKRRVELRIDEQDMLDAEKHGIDVHQLFKNSLKQALRILGTSERASCSSVFPRVTEAAKSAVNPMMPKKFRMKK